MIDTLAEWIDEHPLLCILSVAGLVLLASLVPELI